MYKGLHWNLYYKSFHLRQWQGDELNKIIKKDGILCGYDSAGVKYTGSSCSGKCRLNGQINSES